MFNFHKPRVYRSADGCCICRAKSSSSRFTTSRKYEKESMQCFNLNEPRNGEICNACVLLVKRYKRLPAGSKRHWGHVVDARAGPGTKSLAKQKKRENEAMEGKGNSGCSSSSSFIPEKFAKIFKKNRKGKITAVNEKKSAPNALEHVKRPQSSSPSSEHQSDSNESYDEERANTPPAGTVGASSAAPYQTRKRTAAAALAANHTNGLVIRGCLKSRNTVQQLKLTGSKRRRMLPPLKHRRAVDNVPFFEEDDLVRLEVCCGIVFQSLSLGSHCYIIDTELYKPCEKHRRMRQEAAQQQAAAAAVAANAANTAVTAPMAVSVATAQPTAATAASNSKPISNPTPALKKHHLFYKRQSESFPQGDINRISPVPLNKTEPAPMPMPLSPTTNAGQQHSTSSQPAVAQQQQQQQTSVSGGNSNLSLIMKPAVNNKLLESTNGIILQPVGGAAAVGVAGMTTTAVGAASPSSLSSSSNCSTSSAAATKFNDNSSDSGFDEHVLERKSASPPTQEEVQMQKKTRGGATTGMQRLILASGLPISGQAQNLVLAGNEFTARFVQQRQQATPAAAALSAAAAPAALKLNVVGSQSGNTNNANSNSNNSNANGNASENCNNKMRAIFNNTNTIQHENGVTTILPASSLAASNQTAAMNAIAPSTVTITPTPIVAGAAVNGGVAKKIALSAQLAAQALPLSLSNGANALVANPKFVLLKAGKLNSSSKNSNNSTADVKMV